MKFFPATVSLTLLLVGACSPSLAAERDGRIALRASVTVNRENILLSDLLPEGVAAAFEDKSSAIQLGRAPEPGSVRVFDGAQIEERLTRWPDALAKFSIPSQILIRRSGWPIEDQNVRGAIRTFLRQNKFANRDLAESGSLHFPMIAARQPSPALEVIDAKWDDRQQAITFRVHCVDRTLCGSFLARADLTPSAAAMLREKHSGEANSDRPRQTAAAHAESGAALVEAGKAATLILEGANLRITIAVKCLDRGALHQEVRALDGGSRRVFQAQVVGPALLHANL